MLLNWFDKVTNNHDGGTELVRACPTGRRHQGRHTTSWRDLFSRLDLEVLYIFPKELKKCLGRGKCDCLCSWIRRRWTQHLYYILVILWLNEICWFIYIIICIWSPLKRVGMGLQHNITQWSNSEMIFMQILYALFTFRHLSDIFSQHYTINSPLTCDQTSAVNGERWCLYFNGVAHFKLVPLSNLLPCL